MPKRRIRWVALSLVAAACVGGWFAFRDLRKVRFLHDLHLVGFSRSMIGSPRDDQELAAQRRADELGIDLFAAYEDSLEKNVRFDLAWMLITRESLEYSSFAKQNVASVPWPEVRIWATRLEERSITAGYRGKLRDLMLASPTSEGKLAAALGYREQGKIKESEDAYYDAMTHGLFWDALDAADQLLESERYRAAAANHHLSVVGDAEHFTPRAAVSILNLHGKREELSALLDACRKERRGGPNRKWLVEELTRLIEQDNRQPGNGG